MPTNGPSLPLEGGGASLYRTAQLPCKPWELAGAGVGLRASSLCTTASTAAREGPSAFTPCIVPAAASITEAFARSASTSRRLALHLIPDDARPDVLLARRSAADHLGD
eukprot:CAMPEP_0117675312 /NCGR_PEP_ID=MMETSP0804-20121206/15535_1 /TAXON_ID=1074897 /ORGANISM="Tetraselmis astigmatica, Strain CCMP880" /LENGTH=108 /DNA_ID=CAMNT_0005484301 /DNA_START=384 /DNA_END=710 /DNA_ORIENTATION=+